MHKKRWFCTPSAFLMIVLALAGPVHATLDRPAARLEPELVFSEVYVSGSTHFTASADTRSRSATENRTSFGNRTIIKADYRNFSVSGISDYQYFGPDGRHEEYRLDLHEMVLRQRAGALDLILGKQVRRWGKTDQISPVDTLNPENVTEFILPVYEDRKIPIWMASATLRKERFFMEGVLIPFFEPSRFDYFGTDWAVFSHMKTDIAKSGLPEGLKDYVSRMAVQEKKPASGKDSFEYAARLGGTVRQLDFGLTYHYANEDLPAFLSFPVKNLSIRNPGSPLDLLSGLQDWTLTPENIKTAYLRTHIAGLEFETVLSDFGIRGEAAVRDRESFLTESLTSIRRPSLFWVLGADYLSPNAWYVNLQFAHQKIFRHDPSTLFLKPNNYFLIGEIRKDLISDWLNGSIQFTHVLSDGSCYLSPRLRYAYIRNLEILLGLNLFEGAGDTLMGRYNENDQFFINLKYHF